MTFRFDHFFHFPACTPNGQLDRIEQQLQKLDTIMSTQAELVADLKTVRESQQKTATEIAAVQAASDAQTQKIADLEAVIRNMPDASPELVSAVADVKAGQQALDDEIPDVATPPTQ